MRAFPAIIAAIAALGLTACAGGGAAPKKLAMEPLLAPAPAVPVNIEATEPGYKSGRDPFSDVEVQPGDWAETPVPGTVLDVLPEHDDPEPLGLDPLRGSRQVLADPWDVAPAGWTRAPECDAPVIMPKRGREDVLWRWWARPALCPA